MSRLECCYDFLSSYLFVINLVQWCWTNTKQVVVIVSIINVKKCIRHLTLANSSAYPVNIKSHIGILTRIFQPPRLKCRWNYKRNCIVIGRGYPLTPGEPSVCSVTMLRRRLVKEISTYIIIITEVHALTLLSDHSSHQFLKCSLLHNYLRLIVVVPKPMWRHIVILVI